MSRVLRHPADGPWILQGSGASCRVRPWPYAPRTAQMAFYSHGRMAPAAQLASWLADIAEAGFTVVRTGAVRYSAAGDLQALGFATIQTLVLLEHTRLDTVGGRAGRATRRLAERADGAAAAVDLAAFGRNWAVDAPSLHDIRTATAHHRSRRIDAGGRLAAYAISGRDQHQGFLQRLAVDPQHQGHGLGRALTLDSLRWMHRRGARRALVNTHTENAAALSLYRSVGFTDGPEPLLVLERTL